MFYSKNSLIFNNPSTYLESSRVFTGEYWDEFGITPYLVPDEAQVLMLGLGGGGGIRSLLASQKKISLTAVDMDAASVCTCREMFTQEFPQLIFEAIAREAQTYLMETNRQFDCIWLDLYLPEAYCPLFFSDEFYRLVQRRLLPQGVLLVNTYGLPNHFHPLQRAGVQARVAQKLGEHFTFLSALPYRRNLTLIAANQMPQKFPCAPHSDLKPLDIQVQRSLELRIADLKELAPLNTDTEKDDTSLFANLNRRMSQLWSKMVEEVNLCGGNITSARELIALIQNADAMSPILRQALRRNSSLLLCVPILAAGESRVQTLKLDWLFAWLLDNAQILREANLQVYRQIWLTQLQAIVLHPDQHYLKYQSDLYRLVVAELK